MVVLLVVPSLVTKSSSDEIFSTAELLNKNTIINDFFSPAANFPLKLDKSFDTGVYCDLACSPPFKDKL
jgi:hypothetical protein